MADVTADATLMITLDAQDDAGGIIDELTSQINTIDTSAQSASAGAEAAFSGAGTAAETMGTDVTTSADGMEAAMAGAGGAAELMGGNIMEAGEHGAEAAGIFAGLGETFGALRETLGGIGLALDAAFIGGGESLEKYGLQVQKVAFMTNSSTESASRLISGFEGQGISADQATSMLQRMEMRLGTMGQQQEKAALSGKASTTVLDQLGLSLKDAAGHAIPMTEIIPQIVDKLKGVEDPTERARMATQLFGRNWAQLGPLIESGGDAFRKAMGDADKYGTVLGKDQVEMAHRAHVAHMQLMEGLQGLGNQFGVIFLPILTAVTTKIGDLLSWINHLNEGTRHTFMTFATAGAILGPIIGGMEVLIKAGEKAGEGLGPISSHISAVGKALEAFRGAIAAVVEHIPLLGGIARPFLAVLGPIGGLVALFFTLKSAYENIGLVHIALLPLVNAVRDGFHAVWEALRNLHGTLSAGGSIWDGFYRVMMMIGTSLGISRAAMEPLAIALGQVRDIFNAVVGPVMTWNDAILKGKDPMLATQIMFRELAVHLDHISPPLAAVARDLYELVSTFQRTRDVGLTLAVLWQQLGGNAHDAGQVMTTVNGAIKNISDTFHGFVATLQRTHDIGLAFAVVWQHMGGSVQQSVAIWRAIDGILHGVGQAGHIVMEALQPLADRVMRQLVQAAGDLHPMLGILQTMFSRIGPTITALTPLFQVLAAVLGGVLGVAIVTLGGLFQALATGLSVLIPAAIQIVTGAFQILFGVWTLAATLVSGFIQVVGDLLSGNWKKAWNDSVQTVKDAAGSVGMIFSGLGNLIVGLWTATVGTVVGVVGGFVQGVIGAFQNLYNTLVGHSIIPDLVNGVIDWFKRLPEAIIGVITGMVDGASAAATTLATGIMTGITTTLSTLGSALSSAIQSGLDAVSSLAGAAYSAAAALGSSIVSGITGALSGLGGALRGAVSNAMSFLPGPAQDALHAIGLADGGIVTRPTFAMIGEGASHEAVVPLDRLPGLMAQAIAQVGGMGGGGQTVNLVVDGRVLARVVLDHAGQMSRLRGTSYGSGAG